MACGCCLKNLSIHNQCAGLEQAAKHHTWSDCAVCYCDKTTPTIYIHTHTHISCPCWRQQRGDTKHTAAYNRRRFTVQGCWNPRNAKNLQIINKHARRASTVKIKFASHIHIFALIMFAVRCAVWQCVRVFAFGRFESVRTFLHISKMMNVPICCWQLLKIK